MSNAYDKSPLYQKLAREFFLRRLHSFAGFLFLIFLCEHLFTNSLASLYFGDDGKGFISMVNSIQSLPYLPVWEILFIALPLAVHVWWGVYRLKTAKYNSFSTDGSKPDLADFSRNRAYTWQRLTSIVLIFAIALHVLYMRVIHEPQKVSDGYTVRISKDAGLIPVASRLNINLSEQNGDVIATADSIGGAYLLVLRDAYKSIPLCLAYTVFVLMAAFHGCNGLWTMAITWGLTLTERSRQMMRTFSNSLMLLLIFLGLVTVWGVYWINLRV